MASSYASPKMPSAPHTTPASIRARLRPPIHNPYDKFTGKEFDAWIGGLTSKIRRVLGHEELTAGSITPLNSAGDVSAYDDGPMEDSFAEVKARRAAKGKGRADPADDVQDEEFIESIIIPDGTEDAEDGVQDAQVYTAQAYEEDYSDDEVPTQKGLPDTIEISSDEDEEPSAHRSSSIGYDVEDYDSVEENDQEFRDGVDDEDELQVEGDEAEEFPLDESEQYGTESVDISDPWAGPSAFAEDFYSGGDIPQGVLRSSNPHMLPTEGPHLDDEDFPPATTPSQPVEIMDPWSGPRTYAEDFYSGGDITSDPSSLTPSHLTPAATTPHDEDDVGMVLTPGIAASPSPSAESPRSVLDVDELEDESQSQDSKETVDGEVPTFSMPMSKADGTDGSVSPAKSLAQNALEGVLGSDIEEEDAEVLHSVLHDHSMSPIRASEHLDWNFPPAFPGRLASAAGHLHTSPDEHGTAQSDRAQSPEVLEISDDEEAAAPEGKENANRTEDPGLEPSPAVAPEQEQSTAPSEAMAADAQMPEGGNYDFDTFESLYLANEFHELDQGPSVTDGTAAEEHYEPICVESVDFGELPIDTPPDDRSRDVISPEILSIFEQLRRQESVPEQLGTPPDKQDEPDTSATLRPLVGPANVKSGLEKPDVNITEAVEGTDARDLPPGDQGEDAEVLEDERAFDRASRVDAYEVLEVDVREGPADDRETSREPDVLTDLGEGSVYELDYVVEEVATEGRLTVEPEVHIGSPAADALGSQPEYIEESVRLETVILPPTPADAVSPSGEDGEDSTVLGNPEDDNNDEASATHVEGASQLTLASSSGPSALHEHESPFGDGIPMPVSADPTVPDPASIHTTPLSPRSPVDVADDSIANEGSSRGGDKERRRAAASAIPPALLKHLSGHKSISGLFTPLSEADSSPTESVRGSEYSEDEAAQGQPLLDDIGNGPPEGAPMDAVPDVVAAEDRYVPAVAVPEVVDHPAADATSEVPPSTSTPTNQTLPEASGASVDPREQRDPDGGEADADGDVDSDYDICSSRERSLPPQDEEVAEHATTEGLREDSPEHAEAPVPSPANEEPQSTASDEIPQETSQTASLTLGDVRSPPDIPGLGTIPEESVPQLSLPAPTKAEAVDNAAPAEQKNAGGIEGAVAEAPATAEPLSLKPITTSEVSNSLKRKRREPTPVPQRLTRSMSAKGLPVVPEITTKPVSKGKGKAKAVDDAFTDNDDAASVALSSLSEDVPSNLEAISEYGESSRSGSVVSSEPPHTVESSPQSAHPPTLTQTMFSFIHAHGLLHHHHGKQPPQAQGQAKAPPPAQVQVQSQKPPSEPRVSPSPAVEAPQDTYTSKEPSPPATKATTSTSPVTRSNCRFHKISLPKEENGPRVYFVVPGCSLTDKELMEEEEIEDHGPVRAEEQAVLIPDIESLDLSSYLLGILRQLVGVDLLREQEIYYLVPPGEKPRFKGKRRVKHRARESISGRNSFGPQLSTKSTTARKRQLTGASDSISASSSISRGQRPTGRSVSASVSISDNEIDEDEPKPKAKKRKTDAVDESASASTATQGATDTEPSQSAAKLKTRRGKRLGTDAAAYKPGPPELEESETEEESATSRKRRATRTRKRTRGDDAAENDSEAVKKRKITSTNTADPEADAVTQQQPE